jgi:regulator of protease activity HflC (stomatin/prohibitin superfamily)
MKTITVVKNFVLTLEDHTTRAFKKGVHVVEAEIADHWYVKANTDVEADAAALKAKLEAEALAEKAKLEAAALAKAEAEAAALKAKAEADAAAVVVAAVEAPVKKAK